MRTSAADRLFRLVLVPSFFGVVSMFVARLSAAESTATSIAAPAAGLGQFAHATDVGKITLTGSSEFLAGSGHYRITGSGANIWGKEDAFHFLWREHSGDLSFTIDATWPGAGREAHRKVCAMARAGLESDAAYVDVAIHGDGLIELQYRKEKGGNTFGVRTPITAPATVKLERDGDVFTVSVARKGGSFQPVGSLSLPLPDPLCVGLAVSAHNATVRETALISNIALTNRVAQPAEKRVRETR
ncbi:MAG: hypothetical protein Q7S40_19245 [Opitutaceae bacterium]|nr:hypothetical protein [Opitutaceae bacterium]